MKMKEKIFAIIIFILASCTAPLTPQVVQNITPTPLPTSAETPTVAMVPTDSALPFVATHCVANSKSFQDFDLNGFIAVKKISHQLNSPSGFFLMDANTKGIARTNDNALIARISPDRIHIAYTYDKADAEYIRIADSALTVVADFADFPAYGDGLWEDYFNWQNTDQIRIVTANLNNVYQYLINPFTQERIALKTNWEKVFRPADPYHDKVADWKFDKNATSFGDVYGANILYDPTLTLVIFPKDGGEVSLVTVEDGRELARANFTDWGRLPFWSPDGEYLTIVNRQENVDEFYLVSRDGHDFQQITDFGREFDYVTISEYSWSPNGERIAFWFNQADVEKKDGAQSELAILDIPSRQVTRLCIQGISTNAYEPWSMNNPEPIWSPDGKYILISQWDDPANPKNYYVLAIDPVSGGVDKISKNTAPIGWMVKP
jgi:hypothetical protein